MTYTELLQKEEWKEKSNEILKRDKYKLQISLSGYRPFRCYGTAD